MSSLFPVIISTSNYSDLSGTDHNVTLPKGRANGDLLLISIGSTKQISHDSSWIKLSEKNLTTFHYNTSIRVVDGSESNTTLFKTTSSVGLVAVGYNIAAWTGNTIDLIIGTPATDISNTPDPPDVTLESSVNYVVIPVLVANGLSNSVTVYPTGYNLRQINKNNNIMLVAMSANNVEGTGASIDPSVYNTALSLRWITQTIAIPYGNSGFSSVGKNWGYMMT